MPDGKVIRGNSETDDEMLGSEMFPFRQWSWYGVEATEPVG